MPMKNVYGDVGDSSDIVRFKIVFLRDGAPEMTELVARPAMDVRLMKRAVALQDIAQIQHVVNEGLGLDPSMIEKLEEIFTLIEGMLVNSDGVRSTWKPELAPLPPGAPQGSRQKVRLPNVKIAENPTIQQSDPRLQQLAQCNATFADYDNPLVGWAQTFEAGSSKRKWQHIMDDENECVLGIDTVAELMGDLMSKIGGDRPLDESSSSGEHSPTPPLHPGSPVASASPA